MGLKRVIVVDDRTALGVFQTDPRGVEALRKTGSLFGKSRVSDGPSWG